MDLLAKLVHENNEQSRAPLAVPAAEMIYSTPGSLNFSTLSNSTL